MTSQDRQPYHNTRHDSRFQFFGAPTVMRSTGETTDGHFRRRSSHVAGSVNQSKSNGLASLQDST